MANIVENFMSLSNAKKITYLLIVAGAIVLTVVLFQWANQPEYQTLFANLSQGDAASILDQLRKDRVPYKV